MKSPIIGFYALLANYLDHTKGDRYYEEVMNAKRKAAIDDSVFNGFTLEALRTMRDWSWKVSRSEVAEPHDSIRQIAFKFMRQAFKQLSTLKRRDSNAMETYRQLAHIIMRTEEAYPILFFEKVVRRGKGATILMHVSDQDTFVERLILKYPCFGDVTENGMILMLPQS
jgi:hypothetical protein